jgi:site-specific recombinase XerD
MQDYMKETFLEAVIHRLESNFTAEQIAMVAGIVKDELFKYEISTKASDEEVRKRENSQLVGVFLSAKRIEGCSEKTIHYYQSSIEKLLMEIQKQVCEITTNDIRCYLATQQDTRRLSKVTIDNLRRIFSTFFSWLEDEDYITKSPVRRIHKVRTDILVKEVLSDESMEVLRDSCTEIRDIAMIDLLASTGIRVEELVKMNRDDIDFQERQCVVFGKGNKEREVYFNARTKIHLKRYLEQ